MSYYYRPEHDFSFPKADLPEEFLLYIRTEEFNDFIDNCNTVLSPIKRIQYIDVFISVQLMMSVCFIVPTGIVWLVLYDHINFIWAPILLFVLSIIIRFIGSLIVNSLIRKYISRGIEFVEKENVEKFKPRGLKVELSPPLRFNQKIPIKAMKAVSMVLYLSIINKEEESKEMKEIPNEIPNEVNYPPMEYNVYQMPQMMNQYPQQNVYEQSVIQFDQNQSVVPTVHQEGIMPTNNQEGIMPTEYPEGMTMPTNN